MILYVHFKLLVILKFTVLSVLSLIQDENKKGAMFVTDSADGESTPQIENTTVPEKSFSHLPMEDMSESENSRTEMRTDYRNETAALTLSHNYSYLSVTTPSYENTAENSTPLIQNEVLSSQPEKSNLTGIKSHPHYQNDKPKINAFSPLNSSQSRDKSEGRLMNIQTTSLDNRGAVKNSLTNLSREINRQSKELISEENLMEYRNYNYDQLHPAYNQPTIAGSPSASGEDAYHLQTFATITRDIWPNYQQSQELITYPTLTTTVTPKPPPYVHAGPGIKRWKFPFFSYRHAPKFRAPVGAFHKDDPMAHYDYLEDMDPVESINMHRWSHPQSGPDPGANLGPVRSKFHRYHEGTGYDYGPQSYDFSHVHDHGIPMHEVHHETGYKWDFSKISMILLLKLAFAKLQSLGALKLLLLMLLKTKFLLAALFFKAFLVLKALKLLRSLLIPFLLLSLLPLLLLGPLAALLPLIMNLTPQQPDTPDIPDVPDPTDAPEEDTDGGKSGRNRKKIKNRAMEQIQRVLRSEQCLERIACELASKKQTTLVAVLVNWSLDSVARLLPLPKVKAYAKAYKIGRQKDKSSPSCSSKYKCSTFRRRSHQTK